MFKIHYTEFFLCEVILKLDVKMCLFSVGRNTCTFPCRKRKLIKHKAAPAVSHRLGLISKVGLQSNFSLSRK